MEFFLFVVFPKFTGNSFSKHKVRVRPHFNQIQKYALDHLHDGLASLKLTPKKNNDRIRNSSLSVALGIRVHVKSIGLHAAIYHKCARRSSLKLLRGLWSDYRPHH